MQDKWLHEEAKRTSHRQHIEQCNTERINNLQVRAAGQDFRADRLSVPPYDASAGVWGGRQQLETGMRSQIQSLGTDMTLAGKEAERDMVGW